ncbi:nitrogenase molybdenum-iron protein subunit beta [Paenibacillus sp. HN-1]|uniref:nitrogenase molybdenum-iron protein subunit beta n=1 Tax=Paenibacillus TaxID=44249 RepID=UPI001CA9DD58|nr:MULTISPECIES: nitrogenase molybdenum-iron protein subunit beta [Paenibacillus]MBY9078612.1 nitrogenase molybdenum-iron protein subunit beta [Paenibacillus sp. CGMCC 1.18879]MBY9084148.1 nitrogenase molybdenum-iron protein subunit beta [Paenibacillus sinensis]
MSKEKLNIPDYNTLFTEERFVQQRENKKQFEAPCSAQETAEALAYSKSAEYMEKNFDRKAVVINPHKACQPLGAMMAALGFEKTLPFVHGSQGCNSYFRSHLSRHFKEPTPAVSSSMTEDAAVFGGLSNMVDGLENAVALYKPDMVAVCTTCMAEVIGDDLSAFIGTARQKGAIAQDMPVTFANTPSFIGSHTTGYDAMLKNILSQLYDRSGLQAAPGTGEESGEKLNVMLGFEGYTGNFAEIRKILNAFDTKYTLLGDHSGNFDSPATGEYEYYYGGTKLDDVPKAANALGSLVLQKYTLKKTQDYISGTWKQQISAMSTPLGVKATDKLLEAISELTGLPVPASLIEERGRVIDAYTDSHPYLHGKRVALVGDPDLLIGLIGFCLEVGMEPVHILCSNGDVEYNDVKFKVEAEALLASSPFGSEATVYVGKDLWHLRSLLINDPVDLVVGSSHVKFAAKDSNTPLIRVGFPIFDRHHMHRSPTIGYQGALNLLTLIVNTVLEQLDINNSGFNYDLVR